MPRATKVFVHCANCAALFPTYPARPAKFCGHPCYIGHYTKYEVEIRRCANCSVPFETKFRPFSNSSGKYCSWACACNGRRKPLSEHSVWVQTPEAKKASSKVSHEIAAGRLTRPSKCSQCDKDCKPVAAHHDYSRPLDVRWLCPSCHSLWDRACPKGGAMRIR